MKITFMGAGSTIFARNVLGDCMCVESLRDAEMALYDIDGRASGSEAMLQAINTNINAGRAKIKCYLGVEERKEALCGAQFVVNAIQVGGYEPCTVTDFEIPEKIRPSPDPLRIPWASAVFSGRCAPSRCWRSLPGIWRRSVPTPGSSTIPTPWLC